MQKKVLITGASGFVGGFLVAEALKRDLIVHAAIRKSSSTEYLQDPRITFIYIDFADTNGLGHILSDGKYDYIIHNAGLTKSAVPDAYFEVNARYLDNILLALVRNKLTLEKFVFISSLAAKGPAEFTNDGIVTEDSEPHPVTNYGRSKLEAEIILKGYTQIPYTIIRPTAVYGPREKDLFTVYELINKGLEMTVGMKDQQLTFIYVKDLVRVILDATLSDKKNVAYFVTDLEVHTSTAYNAAIRAALCRKRTLKVRLPIPIVRMIGYLAEKSGKVTGNYPALNIEKVNELEAKSWKCDTKNLQEDLAYAPEYNLKKGLAESIDWYKRNNWIK